jgi:DNA adenine methylase
MGHYGGYTISDFEKLLQTLTTLKEKFMLCSYPSEILSEYATKTGCRKIEMELPRPDGGGRKIEALTMNYKSV